MKWMVSLLLILNTVFANEVVINEVELKKKLEDHLDQNAPKMEDDIVQKNPAWKPELTVAFHRLLQEERLNRLSC